MIGLLLSALDPFKTILLWGLKKIPLLLENPALKDHLNVVMLVPKLQWWPAVSLQWYPHGFSAPLLQFRGQHVFLFRLQFPDSGVTKVLKGRSIHSAFKPQLKIRF